MKSEIATSLTFIVEMFTVTEDKRFLVLMMAEKVKSKQLKKNQF
jgi:hypothetical protein